jgi:hypothetical protein
MTMAFAVIALSAVNNGLVMRREREAWRSAPIFPYLGWIMLGWALTWAAVELDLLQRLLDTVSLTGVDPNDEHAVLPLAGGFAAVGTPDTCQCRSAYEPHRDRTWPHGRFAQKPTSRQQGIHETHPARPPTLRNTASSLPHTFYQGIRRWR